MSLVEMVVAMAIVTVGLLGMLTEIVAYFHQQSSQRAHATALRLATTALEDARRLPHSALAAGSVVDPPVTKGSVSYQRTYSIQMCSPTTQTSCVTPAAGAPSVARMLVTVSWTDSKGQHHVSLSTADADTATSTLPGSSSGLLSDTTGATGTSVTVSSFTVSPSSTSVDSSGHPSSNITITLTATGLSSSSTVPVTWTDDSGAHQVTLTNTSATTWAATVSKASITRAVSTGTQTVTFAATVPGVHSFPTATLTLSAQPAFVGSCTVTASPIVLTPLTRKTALPETLSCQTSGLVSTDSVRAVYATGSSTATLTLTTSNGSSWAATLPAGTTMVSSGSSEGITFTMTRTSDSYTASQSASVTLA
jgi:Tfp pilus assembly protein PilV